MIRTMVAAIAAVAVAGTVLSGVAQAQCYWTGYAWSCAGPGGYGPPGYNYGPNDPAFGYEPRGLPHPYGPEPGGGYYHEGQYGIGHSN
jgi:hypothetical protein